MNLLLMGAQGSGKGTAAETLKVELNIPTISTGDLFRSVIASGSDLGKELKTIIDAGNLVPDELTLKILKERLSQDDCKTGYILDGFPRTIEQAYMLDDIAKIDNVIYLDVDYEIVIERITGRRTCPKCGHIHNIKYSGDPNYCSVCGERYIIRSDDTEEAIKKRLATFEEKTLPIVDYYKKKGLVITVDSSKNPEYTMKQIMEALGR